jgi:HSP20 family molecular chaperone IbpA
MLQNLPGISLKSEFLRNNKKFSNLEGFLEHSFEDFLKKYLFSVTENSNRDRSRMPLPQIDVAETDQAYYFQMEIPKAYKQNTGKGVYKNENSLLDNEKQGIMDLITQNYKRAIQRSITPSININECELNTSFIDSVLSITVLKKNNELSLQTNKVARKEIKLFFA